MIVYNLLYISLTCASSKSVADAIIFKIEFVVVLEKPLTVDVISVYLMYYIGIAQEFHVVYLL